ncbi:MAG: 2-oxoacid:acceptor oxidoreductase subunit alpha [Desulfobacterales bacterium]|nr:2-oxoacid:acceptor oxidoreductase subunit alpha [Desulfobacterales bacterium]
MTVDISVLIGGEAGQGIQTIGLLMARTCHRAGLYVMVINDFESRIRGGHSFIQLRISDRPVHGPTRKLHMVVALDERTYGLHQPELTEGGLVLISKDHADTMAQHHRYKMVDFGGVAKKAGSSILANTVAAGTSLALLGAPFDLFENILKSTFNQVEEKRLAQNIQAAQYGYTAAEDETFKWSWPWAVTSPKGRLVDGAQAVAFGALAGDCRFSAFYPMSPATGIIQHLVDMAQTVPLVIEQAEDEIAAVNMVIGAAFAGVRAMTATSGGGFSLMSEGLGLAAITETPIVIVNAQRPGPATGLPTRTAQADLQFVIHASQDEFPRFVFAPGTPFEAFSVTARAFELSERFQVPAIILMDQYLNDSLFVAEESFEAPETVTSYTAADDLENPVGYRRYAFTDSGISPRALPCKGPALVKVCSDEHDEEGHITEDADTRDAMVAKRFAKVAAMRKEIRPPEVIHAGSDILLVSWGSMRGAMEEAVNQLRADDINCGGVHVVDLWPFPDTALSEILEKVTQFFVVEQNQSAQLGQLIRQQTGCQYTDAVLKYNGRPMSAGEITDAIKTKLR